MKAYLEEAESLDLVQLVEREAVVDACGDDEQVSGQDVDADPRVRRMFWRHKKKLVSDAQRTDYLGRHGRETRTTDVEKPSTREDVPNLLVLVHMSIRPSSHASGSTAATISFFWSHSLLEERLELRLVQVPEALLRHVDDVPVLVPALHRERIDRGLPPALAVVRDAPVQHPGGLERLLRHGTLRVVREALVAGDVVEVVGTHRSLLRGLDRRMRELVLFVAGLCLCARFRCKDII